MYYAVFYGGTNQDDRLLGFDTERELTDFIVRYGTDDYGEQTAWAVDEETASQRFDLDDFFDGDYLSELNGVRTCCGQCVFEIKPSDQNPSVEE